MHLLQSEHEGHSFPKLFRWCFFATLLYAPLLAKIPPTIQIQDGSKFTPPAGFNHQIWSEIKDEGPVMVADNGEGTVFVFADLKSEKYKDRPDHILFQALDWQELEIQVVGQVQNSPRTMDPILRIQVGPEHLEYLAIGLRRNTYSGPKWFFLVGYERSFFAALPNFYSALEGFNPGLEPLQKSQDIPFTYLFAAIALILANVGMIWYAFRRLAYFKYE